MPTGLDPLISTAEWIRACENDPSVYGSDVDVDNINTTSEWSSTPREFSYEDRRPIVPDSYRDTPSSSEEVPAAATFEEARRWQRRAVVPPVHNPFVDTDEDKDVERSREGEGRVRVLTFDHLPPQYHPALTLILPENLPRLQRGQVFVIPVKLTLQVAHPDDVADL